jgi:fatty acid synthase subunit alpha/holo-[acyl-carrier protein] synthase
VIIGIGIDLIDSRRVAKMLSCNSNAIFKLMLPQEYDSQKKHKSDSMKFAKIFSAKEAIIKAIGNITTFSWHEMEICHKENGGLFAKVYGEIHKQLLARIIDLVGESEEIDEKKIIIHLSFTDEPPYASTVCVIEYSRNARR